MSDKYWKLFIKFAAKIGHLKKIGHYEQVWIYKKI